MTIYDMDPADILQKSTMLLEEFGGDLGVGLSKSRGFVLVCLIKQIGLKPEIEEVVSHTDWDEFEKLARAYLPKEEKRDISIDFYFGLSTHCQSCFGDCL